MKPREISPRRVTAIVITLAIIGGCVARPKPGPVVPLAIEQQSLDQLQPPVSLPNPATQPSAPASLKALQLYAQGRDALLHNRKSLAIEKLSAAIELDPHSAAAFRDLGYAWLGMDNDRAYSAYRTACEIDPSHVDSRIQLSRLLVDRKNPAAAIEQLRLARLTRDYAQHDADAAMVDLLLGKLLSDQGYKRAALECLLRVLPALDNPSFGLRSRPELVELRNRPTAVKIWIADLASQIGEYDQALKYYDQIRHDDPATSSGIELRIVQMLAKKGDIDQASGQMLQLVERFQASRASMQPYLDLFADRGGDRAALETLNKLRPGESQPTALRVLEARLYRRMGDAKTALEILRSDQIVPTVAAVREAMMAFSEWGDASAAHGWLLKKMNEHPDAMPALWRGWSMLTHGSQRTPLRVNDLAKMEIPPDVEAARGFVLARLASLHGQPVTTRNALSRASSLDPSKVRQWVTARVNEGPPDVEYTSQNDLERYIVEFSNEPDYLSASATFLVKNNQDIHLLPALQAVVDRDPQNLVATGVLVAILQAKDRKSEAIVLVERAASSVTHAAMLYQVSMMMSQLDQPAAAEKLLRRSHDADANYPPTCNDLGYLLADAGRELDFAEALLYRAVGHEPENPAYIDSLGWLLYKRGKFDQAHKYLEQALAASDPADPIVLDHAADVAYRVSDPVSAKKYWEMAIEQIRIRSTSDPQLRLKIERKLKQLSENQPVDVAESGQ